MAKYSGIVKSWGVAKGYGFIECAQMAGDVFFGRHDMPDDLRQVSNQSGLFEFKGREVHFGVAMKDGKQHATELTLAPMEGVQLVGAVKSFNPQKGYGFFTVSALGGADVFFAKRDVPPQHQASPLAGRVAVFIPVQQPDGQAQAKDIQFCELGFGAGPADAGIAVATPMAGRLPHQLAGMGLTSQQLSHLSAITGGILGGGPSAARSGGLTDGQGAQGTVKSFNSEKGFGFITCASTPADLYFKSADDISVGMEIAFTVKIMPDGKPQARDLVAALSEGQTAVGTVKTYNGGKGFGFIQIPDQPNDVHFRKEVVPSEFQEQELVGKTVRFTITINNGKPQAQSAQFLARPPAGYVAPTTDVAGGTGIKRPHLGLGSGFTTALPAKRPRVEPSSNAGWVLPAATSGAGMQPVGQMTGTIKSFNPGKGFGFIESSSSPGLDIYFKAAHLGAHAQSEGLSGSRVSFHASSTPDGKLQASSIQLF